MVTRLLPAVVLATLVGGAVRAEPVIVIRDPRVRPVSGQAFVGDPDDPPTPPGRRLPVLPEPYPADPEPVAPGREIVFVPAAEEAGGPGGPDGGQPTQFWADGAFLRWRVKQAPVPFPLATLQNLTTALFGAASAQPFPGAPPGLVFDPGLGGRARVGGWLDQSVPFGLEGGAFFLLAQTPILGIVPDIPADRLGLALPLLDIPIPNLLPNLGPPILTLRSLLRSLVPGVTVESVSALWGLEANGLLRVRSEEGFEFVALAGYRHLSLTEAVTLRNPVTDMLFTQFTNTNGAGITNRVLTQTQYDGGQVGGRLTLTGGPLFVELTGKVGFGISAETRDVAGSLFQTLSSGLTPGALLGGLFAQNGVLERRSVAEFAVANELNVRAGLRLGRNLRVFAGYDFLYWSKVARPGDQFDRLLNLGGLLGASRQRDVGQDFYAHGFSCGAELRF